MGTLKFISNSDEESRNENLGESSEQRLINDLNELHNIFAETEDEETEDIGNEFLRDELTEPPQDPFRINNFFIDVINYSGTTIPSNQIRDYKLEYENGQGFTLTITMCSTPQHPIEFHNVSSVNAFTILYLSPRHEILSGTRYNCEYLIKLETEGTYDKSGLLLFKASYRVIEYHE